jgi:DNA-binding response OmpR family regulator
MDDFQDENASLVIVDRKTEPDTRRETATTPHTILIIDDDPDILEMLAWTLEEAGYTVAAVSSGREALQWFQAAEAVGELPALILLDLAMPGMSGSQMVAALRQNWEERVSPIIVISASQSAPLHGRELGAAFTLIKPFEVERLLKLIKQLAV